MAVSRRFFLQSLAGLTLGLGRRGWASPPARVVVVGGGWSGLAAAATLRRLVPDFEVTLVEPRAAFFSLPLSNAVLAGTLDPARLVRDPARAAARHGYRLIRARVDAIDRGRRELRAGDARIDYDWLVLAAGIRHDYAALAGGDAAAGEWIARHHGAAFDDGDEILGLQRRVETFRGREFLIAVAPGPARCPPAPYERAAAIAHRFRRIAPEARLTILDPGGGMPAFRQVFAERHAGRVRLVTHAEITGVDPERRLVRTAFEDFPFDEAVLMPPQRAPALAEAAGISGADGWVAVDPLHMHAAADERIFPVGDLLGPVSPLFGHFPKTAHVALRLGALAAARIAARAAGREMPADLPDSVCHVTTDYGLPEGQRIEAGYRRRGDGLLVQAVRQQRNSQPRGEDMAWLEQALDSLF